MTRELERYGELKRVKFYFPQNFTLEDNKEYKSLTEQLILRENEIDNLKKHIYPTVFLQTINKEIKTLEDLKQDNLSTSIYNFKKTGYMAWNKNFSFHFYDFYFLN